MPGSPGKPDLPDATRLAVDRTLMAHERTLMAWVRTSTSLITFGFSIYKFFQYLRTDLERPPDHGLFGPRVFALLMMSIGVIALVLATTEHRRNLRALRAEYPELVPLSLAMVIAALIGLLGVVGLFDVVFRL